MNKNKKGQGLSLNTIIIAIIVIIVLVIIILITTGQLQKFTTATNQQSGCALNGGYCAENCEGGNTLTVPNDECKIVGQVCCKSNQGSEDQNRGPGGY